MKRATGNPGFTLLEMLVYIALSIVSITLLSASMGGIYMHVITGITSTNARIQAHIALECMKKDLAKAAEIIDCDAHSIVLLLLAAQKSNSIGWAVSDGRLIRRVGSYDRVTRAWKKRVTQLMASGIKDFSILYHSGKMPYLHTEIELANNLALKSIMPTTARLP